jgi:hypothetical protein
VWNGHRFHGGRRSAGLEVLLLVLRLLLLSLRHRHCRFATLQRGGPWSLPVRTCILIILQIVQEAALVFD